jgi:sRNA-binding protein
VKPQETLELLINKYPTVFDYKNIRPLQKGIHVQILAETGLSKKAIKLGLSQWCGSRRYLLVLREGAQRVTLDGSLGDVVTADEQQQAQATLADKDALEFSRWQKYRQEKRERAAKRRAERDGAPLETSPALTCVEGSTGVDPPASIGPSNSQSMCARVPETSQIAKIPQLPNRAAGAPISEKRGPKLGPSVPSTSTLGPALVHIGGGPQRRPPLRAHKPLGLAGLKAAAIARRSAMKRA